MSTTKEWLDKVLSSKQEMTHWLERQYIGEVTAAKRILAVLSEYALSPETEQILISIARDESKHAAWVSELLKARDIALPEIKNPEDRYWKPVLSSTTSFEDVAAAGHHAEHMRLVRIRELAYNNNVADDIRDVFAKILPDEVFHEAAFKRLASKKSLEKMSGKHQEGLRLLGLEI